MMMFHNVCVRAILSADMTAPKVLNDFWELFVGVESEVMLTVTIWLTFTKVFKGNSMIYWLKIYKKVLQLISYDSYKCGVYRQQI